MASSVVQVENLRKCYGSLVAVADLSFSVREGEIFGLLGPNGPMPWHITEYARDRQINVGDNALVRFLDIFHHRLLSFFFRAWADAQKTVDFDRPGNQRWTDLVTEQRHRKIPRDNSANYAQRPFDDQPVFVVVDLRNVAAASAPQALVRGRFCGLQI